MINMPECVRREILESCFEIMSSSGAYLQYTYSPRSSIKAEAYGLSKERMGTIFLNIPPATVWQYKKVQWLFSIIFLSQRSLKIGKN